MRWFAMLGPVLAGTAAWFCGRSDGKPDGKMVDWHRIIEAKVP